MKYPDKPSAELFVATGCSYCPVVLTELSEQLKDGNISSLHITNIAVDNEKASLLNIRSVPWFSLSSTHSFMIFSGNHSAKEIQQWINVSLDENGMQEYIEEYLRSGQLMTVVQALQLKPGMFSSIISMLKDEDTSMDIRIGLDALIENFSDTELLKQNSDAFKSIASTDSPRLQIDALHYIALTGDKENMEYLQEMAENNNPQIKAAALEAIETLTDFSD